MQHKRRLFGLVALGLAMTACRDVAGPTQIQEVEIIIYSGGSGCGSGIGQTISVEPPTASGASGTTLQLALRVNCGSVGGSWMSDDPSKVSVNTTGIITYHSGSTQVCFVPVAESGLGRACGTYTTTSTVETPPTTVSPPGLLSIGSGAGCTNTSVQLTANKTVTWMSSNTGVATVAPQAGVTTVVTAVSNMAGAVQITATSADGAPSVTVVVNVSNASCLPPGVPNITLIIQPILADFHAGVGCVTNQVYQALFEVLSNGLRAADQSVVFTSSNPSVVSTNGNAGIWVYGAAPGTAVITGRPNADPSKSTQVTVLVDNLTCRSNGFTISPSFGSGLPGTTLQLSASQQGGQWSSKSPSVASVSAAGLITFVAPGVADICYTIGSAFYCNTYTTLSPNPTITVTVTAPGGNTMAVGASKQLTLTTNAADPTVTWRTSDNSRVLVNSQTGLITALWIGSARICADLRTNPTNAAAGCVDITVTQTGSLMADSPLWAQPAMMLPTKTAPVTGTNKFQFPVIRKK